MNRLLQFSAISLMLLANAQSAHAYQVTEQDAFAAACDFLGVSTSGNGTKKAASTNALRLSYKSESANGAANYYVFNRGNNGGFVIVSGDDGTDAVLGYSDSGTFDYDNIPEAMKWLLGEYATEISQAVANPAVAQMNKARKKATVTRANIAPMVTSTWDQGAPYNSQCPKHSGVATYTGCVATAMAQIMYYHKWPTQGQGSNTYTYKFYENSSLSEELTRDFSQSTYDWSNMLDSYGSGYSTTQADAVAKLMSDVGISVGMMYGTNASGAITSYTAQALPKYFGYSNSTQFVSRDYYSVQEWTDLLYGELEAKRPVLYSGTGTGGGHAFVCDGYAQGDYFHINWGWSGSSNGYFLLSALNPSALGTGGGNGGFNSSQGAVIGIKPKAADETTIANDAINVDWCGPFKAELTEKYGSDYVKFYAYANDAGLAFVNNSKVTYSPINFGVKVVGTGVDKYVSLAYYSNLQPGYGNYSIGSYTSSLVLSEGQYTVSPACKIDNVWYDMKVPQGANPSLNLTVDGAGKFSFTENKRDYQLSVTKVERTIPFYYNSNFSSVYTISNSGSEDYVGEIDMVMSLADDTKDNFVAILDNVVVPAGKSVDVTISNQLDADYTGACKVWLVDGDVNEIDGSRADVTVKNMTTTSKLVVTNPKVTDTNRESIEYSVDLKGDGGTFIGSVSACLFYMAGSSGYYIRSVDKYVCVDSDKASTVTFQLKGLDSKYYDSKLFLEIYYNNAYVTSSQVQFKATAPKSAAQKLTVNAITMCDATPASSSARMKAAATTRDVLVGVNVTAENGYDGTVKIQILNSDKEEVASSSVNLAMDAGEEYSLKHTFEGLDPNGTYTCVVTDGTAESSSVLGADNAVATKEFTVDKLIPLGIDGIADDAEQRFEVFTPSGILMLSTTEKSALGSLDAGVYIVRTHTSKGVKVSKIFVNK